MKKTMLIDAIHPEETRMVVINERKRLDEYDHESTTKQLIKGNIYLAKVTRVEPSLQACFVDYGGNRHGFLAFSEIHPDYYRIPVADKEALLAEMAAAEEISDDDEDSEDRAARGNRRRNRRNRNRHNKDERGTKETDNEEAKFEDSGEEQEETPTTTEDAITAETAENHDADEGNEDGDASGDEDKGKAKATKKKPARRGRPRKKPVELGGEDFPTLYEEEYEEEEEEEEENEADETTDADKPVKRKTKSSRRTKKAKVVPAEEETVEESEDVAADAIEGEAHEDEIVADADEEAHPDAASNKEEDQRTKNLRGENSGDDVDEEQVRARRRFNLRGRYKIQEVIKKGQIVLVQVVKEERGNKGAAMTTYLSLPGRYCVLMPNTDRGGGVSRKIASGKERKRLKTVLDGFEIPKGMSLILRTAGQERTKAEIKRDFDYLMRLWDQTRQLTLDSMAPAMVYEEGSLMKRAIRDIYNNDIDEIIIEGEESYKQARDFMKTFMPSHVKKINLYKSELTPLFHEYNIEAQIDAIHSPIVQLPSGGYIVMNSTEALVSIDVNSGRSIRERNIEETALKTNLEAADEIARQLRLRDLAGLVVIDFIDMEYYRHDHQVERRFKDALRKDRARIQVGRISSFGLLEMSRQRIRASILETSSMACPHCAGTGTVRSTESAALHVIRLVEEEGVKQRSESVTISVPTAIALYLLNHKRGSVNLIEERYKMKVFIENDDSLIQPNCRIDRKPLPNQNRDKDKDEDNKDKKQDEKSRDNRDNRDNREGQNNKDGKNRRRRNRRDRRDRHHEGREDSSRDTAKENAVERDEKKEDRNDKQREQSEEQKPARKGRGRRSSSKSQKEDRPAREDDKQPAITVKDSHAKKDGEESKRTRGSNVEEQVQNIDALPADEQSKGKAGWWRRKEKAAEGE